MTTKEILNLDYREEKNQKIIQKVLRKIKPLSKFSDESNIPIEALEKVIHVMVSKYDIHPQWLMMSHHEQSYCIYTIGVKTSKKQMGNVYGVSLYEIFAKLTIKIYSEIKSGKIPVKEGNN